MVKGTCGTSMELESSLFANGRGKAETWHESGAFCASALAQEAEAEAQAEGQAEAAGGADHCSCVYQGGNGSGTFHSVR
jgi:hypothetical protein